MKVLVTSYFPSRVTTNQTLKDQVAAPSQPKFDLKTPNPRVSIRMSSILLNGAAPRTIRGAAHDAHNNNC